MSKSRRLLALLNAQQLYCVICGELILSAKDISQEHEPPKSRGGKVIGYAHKACNSRKGALTQEEYELWQKLEAIRTGRLKCLEKSEKSR